MHVELIIVPYEVDRDDSAMAQAPRALLERGFEDGLRKAGHTVSTEVVRSRAEAGRTAVLASVCRRTARLVATSRGRGRFPLVVSGGCLTALGVVSGLQRQGRSPGIAWVDAHGDFNTPEISPSGYWDGMALAAVCGRSLDPVFKRVELQPVRYGRIAHLGGRAFDPLELEDFRRLNVLLVPPSEVAAAGPQVRERLGPAQELYLHVDLDGLDPDDAPAVANPDPGGIKLDDLLPCLAALPRPVALTLAGMNFERVDEKRARATTATCLRLATAAIHDA